MTNPVKAIAENASNATSTTPEETSENDVPIDVRADVKSRVGV